ncbi:hypothetical protein DNU06_15695 [Putridiphycobacter roseus]|uniref:TfoX N-terminal domain-containing protein n=1 Tax=Putridiphycobacter roseus TaxID=2219161 RepID=A0A2W1MV38_9FLAO|nr:hypothetical protein [Putridiphycobacter roseus]PZE15949.1 hypothetical protein DNU06_15695 [Putridiphycobacter roseus]
MAKVIIDIPEVELALYNQLISENTQIERKGKTMPYTAINGHMFSFLDKTGTMALRLSEKDRTLFIDTFNTQLMTQHGRVMKDFVEIPNTLLKEGKKLAIYLQKSADYTASLKPKPSKK